MRVGILKGIHFSQSVFHYLPHLNLIIQQSWIFEYILSWIYHFLRDVSRTTQPKQHHPNTYIMLFLFFTFVSSQCYWNCLIRLLSFYLSIFASMRLWTFSVLTLSLLLVGHTDVTLWMKKNRLIHFIVLCKMEFSSVTFV